MAMADGWFGLSFRDQFDTSALGINLIGAGAEYQLVTNTFTPDFNVHDAEADITNEITGTLGDYTAGGEPLTTPTLAASGGFCTWDATDESLTGMTVTGIRGQVFFDDATTVVVDALILASDFASDFNVTSGTLTIQYDVNGIGRIDYIP